MTFLRYALAAFSLIGPGLCAADPLNIYTYTAADGGINLSNVPADNRYSMLLQEMLVQESKKKVVAAIPPPGLGKLAVHANKAKYDKLVEEVARVHGLEVALLHAVISVESRYDPKIVSRSGAVGLMQLMPETAKRYGVTDSYDAEQNMHGGAKYMRHLLKMFNNDVSLALAAYNAGEHAVIRHGNSIPPFPETRNYVPKVLGYYRKYRKEL